MKITGTSNVPSSSFTASRPGTAVGELNVGKNKPRPFLLRQRQRFAVGAGDADDIMTQAFDQGLDVHGDKGLVLDDQDVGRDLGGKLAAGFLDQRAERLQIAIEHFGSVFFRETFERYQEKGLARPRRNLGQVLLRRQDDLAGLRLAVNRHRIPDFGEQPIERDPRVRARFQDFRAGNQRFHSGNDIGVAGRLAAGQSARIATQRRQMLEYGLRSGQYTLPFHSAEVTSKNAAAQKKFQSAVQRGTMGPLSALAQVNGGVPRDGLAMGERGKDDTMKHRKTNLEPLEPVAEKPENQDPMAMPAANTHKPEARLGREVQARIGQQLRSMYNDVVSQGVPQHLADLVRRLSDQDQD